MNAFDFSGVTTQEWVGVIIAGLFAIFAMNSYIVRNAPEAESFEDVA